MSYIRCLSNPEGLYIYGDSRGRVHISHGVAPPLSSPWRKVGARKFGGISVPAGKVQPLLSIPLHVFEHVARKWGDGFVDKVSYRGLSVAMSLSTRAPRSASEV
jgi:hypothetical protein